MSKLTEKLYIEELDEFVEVRFSLHAEERAKERGSFLDWVVELVEENFEDLLDLKIGEEVRLQSSRTGVVAPVSIDVTESLGEWITVVNVHTIWYDNKIKQNKGANKMDKYIKGIEKAMADGDKGRIIELLYKLEDYFYDEEDIDRLLMTQEMIRELTKDVKTYI